MWTHDGATFYEGDCRTGDRLATAEERAGVALGRSRASKMHAIAAAFDARVNRGLPYGGKVLQIRDADRNLITAIASRAGLYLQQQTAPIGGVTITWPEGGFPWRMADDSFVALSPAEFVAMAQAAADYYGALFYVRSAMKDAVAAAPDVATIETIDTSAGWPGEE